MAKQPTSYLPLAFVFTVLTVLAVAGCGSALTAAEKAAYEDPTTVAYFAGQRLTLNEFEDRYARTVGGKDAAREDSLQEYQDFLERYVNFRLKVLVADSVGYVQDSSIQAEINNYRNSFARPFLIDKEVLNPILSDLYKKNQEMVEASHILLRLSPNAPPEDTLAAYIKLSAIRDSVLQGTDFGDLAFRNSEDPSAQNPKAYQGYRGWLGYFTGGRMVKAFEDVAYATEVGHVSKIFRSEYGYHLLFVHDRRPRVDDIRISHIMIRPKGTTPADSAEALNRIKELKARIEGGEDFATVARENSEEKNSARNGGDLGYLRYDYYNVDPTFRQAAFAMEDLNKVSDVITTPYGYHIFIITDRRKLGTYEEEYESLKNTASRLPRMRKAEMALARESRGRYTSTIDTTALLNIFADIPLESLLQQLRKTTFPDSVRSITVASLGDSTYTFGQVVGFSQDPEHLIRNMLTKKEQVVEIADVFLDNVAISREAAILETRDDEFRQIMDEFRDGLVLFKLMDDSVWTAAAQDSAGLQAYFNAHRDKYRYPDRTRILELYSYSDSLLQATVDRIENGLTWSDLYAELDANTTQELLVDTMLVAGVTNSIYDKALNLPVGGHTELIPHRTGKVVLYNDGMEPARPKTLTEARAEVVNDYQAQLEDRLITRLRERYRAVTFPDRLAGAFTETTPESTTTASTQ